MSYSTVNLVSRDEEQLAAAMQLSKAGDLHEALALAQSAFGQVSTDRLRAEWAECLTIFNARLLGYEDAVTPARQAATIWQTLGDTPRLARVLAQLARFLGALGAPGASAMAQQALELAQSCGDATARAEAHMGMGMIQFLTGHPDQALRFCERAIDIKREMGLRSPLVLINGAEAVVFAGQKAAETDATALPKAISRAIALTREALAEARADGDGWVQRLALNNVAEYSLHVRDTDTAAAALAEIIDTSGTHTWRCQAHYLSVQSKLLIARGQLREAEDLLRTCLKTMKNSEYIVLDCYERLTFALECQGLFEAALQAHREFHACYVRIASEGSQRLARLAAQEHEINELRESAAVSQSLAASLVQSNAELSREAERLKQASLEDSLTGLPNRRRLELTLAELSAEGEIFACAMLDVDHFKQVNDLFSHVVGDAVLRRIGAVFMRLARQEDLLARVGGEEFALLARTNDHAAMHRLCERLRAAVEDTDWEEIEHGLEIRISVGFALSTEATPPDQVMKLADQRLYAAKAAGRNRVIGP